MLKNISKLGTTLNKSEQKAIKGGLRPNADGLLCHRSNRFPPNACPSGYFYSTTWNACCHTVIINEADPIEA